MLDPRERFSKTADLYRKHRPAYPDELFVWIERTTGVAPPARAADIGCGTGISTRHLASQGYTTIGIDPNAEMLAHAAAAGPPTIAYRRGEAERTGLADASVELVIAAQAFHWFPLEATLDEWHRILVPGGWCCVFWNVRAPSPLNDAYEELLLGASEEYRQIPKPHPTLAKLRGALVTREARIEEASFRTEQRLDRDGFLGRAWSSSYVAHGIADRPAFDAALVDLFERYQAQGRVVMPYDTIALAWRPGG
jgi:SAM-dependent methyltransferase